MKKQKWLMDFEAEYNCRFHPIDWWHEVGCPHREWSKDELQDALNKAKQSNAYIVYLIGHPFALTRKGKGEV